MDRAAHGPGQGAAGRFHADPPESSAEDLYQHAPCGYLSMRLDGTITKVNETILTWTGYQREDLEGRRFADLLTIGDRIYHETHYAPLLRMQGTVREIAVELICKDGHRLPTLINSVLQFDETGQPVSVRTAIFDASMRRAYERELVAARQRAEAAEERARVLASTLQATLIPPEPPAIPGLEVAAAYRPAGHGDEVGGDFYDVFDLGDGSWGLVIGDVTGKGAAAAVVTALVRYTVRTAAMSEATPSGVLRLLNEALCRQPDPRFCTAIYAQVRVGDHGHARLTVTVGGHDLPLLLRDGDPLTEIGVTGRLLGAFPEADVTDSDIDLAPGDVVVFYTDGVVEGRRDGEFFGTRLHAYLDSARHERPSEIVHGLLTTVLRFQRDRTSDDIAIVALGPPRLDPPVS